MIPLRRFPLLLVIFMLPLFLASAQNPSATAGTGIEGVITISPAHPGPTKENEPNSAPVANVAFAVESDKGVATSFTTDEQGRFRVSLAPGHYTVRVKEGRIRRCGPFSVDVGSGKMTTVEWRCDSGMR